MTRFASTNGNDTLVGTQQKDTIFGRGGNDKLEGRGGNDWLNGGTGKDSVNGDEGSDLLVGGTGDDSLVGGLDQVGGPAVEPIPNTRDGNDLVYAGNGSDRVFGGLGDDSLTGGKGSDILEGGSDNDTIWGGWGDDVMAGDIAPGEDSLFVSMPGNDALHGGWGNDQMEGNQGEDRIWGERGNDTLVGGEGDDWLSGGEGDDVLIASTSLMATAGGDRDTYTGGAGRDIFYLKGVYDNVGYYDDLDARSPGLNDYALVSDFSTSEDTIQLNGSAADYRLGASPIAGVSGTAIFYKPQLNELVAIVQGDTALNLQADYFAFG